MKRIIIALFACATVALAGFAWIGGSDNVSHAKTGKVEANKVEAGKVEAGKVANAKFTTPIVGGFVAVPHSYPWMVEVHVLDVGGFCGGVIIGNQWVLTAAQCVSSYNNFEIVAGTHDKNINEATQVRQTSTNKFVHESYNGQTIQNDIALIRLSQPLTFNQYIQPINLDNSGNDWAGQVATLAGWGKIYDNSNLLSAELRKVQSPIITNAECADVYDSIITPGVGCTSGDGGRGSCNGDAGGPVFIGNTLVGIMTFGSAAGCELGYPTGFTRVAPYRQWITQKTGI